MGMKVPRHVGSYSVERRIGAGGMGVVAYGRHEFLDREAAIKLRMRGTHEQFGNPDDEDPLLDERFRQGARLQGHCDCPQICRLFDYFESTGWQALVMEYLPGGSIDDALHEAHGPLPIPFALDVAICATKALTYIHERGIVHRDLKPGNLMLQVKDDPTTAKLTDFGVAKSLEDDPGLTVEGANVGTLWYMPPEQFNGEAPTPLSDVYALGATLYEMLTGHIPFRQADSAEIFRRFLDEEPPPPMRESNPAISPLLAALVESALALKTEERIPTARAFECMLWMLRRSAIEERTVRDWRAYLASPDGCDLRQRAEGMPSLAQAGWGELFADTVRDVERARGPMRTTVVPLPRSTSKPLPSLPCDAQTAPLPDAPLLPSDMLDELSDPGDTLETQLSLPEDRREWPQPAVQSSSAFAEVRPQEMQRGVMPRLPSLPQTKPFTPQQLPPLPQKRSLAAEFDDSLELCDTSDIFDRSIRIDDFLMPSEFKLNNIRNGSGSHGSGSGGASQP